MFSTLRLVSSLLLGVAFLMVGVGGLSTIVAFRMGEFGHSSTVVGVVSSMYFVPPADQQRWTHTRVCGIGLVNVGGDAGARSHSRSVCVGRASVHRRLYDGRHVHVHGKLVERKIVQ